jgi:hypothetical protein
MRCNVSEPAYRLAKPLEMQTLVDFCRETFQMRIRPTLLNAVEAHDGRLSRFYYSLQLGEKRKDWRRVDFAGRTVG